MKTVGVIGLGYIGLPTAGLLAESGCRVLGVDVQELVVNTINAGKIHLHEPGLEQVIQRAVASGNLSATLTPAPCDVFLIAVPTPFKDGFAPDISYVESATRLIVPVLKNGDLIILESTVPVGTTARVQEIVLELRPELLRSKNPVEFAHCPERVLPGKIIEELVNNDRIVGGLSESATRRACEFYKVFVKGQIVPTDARTAELCKLSENAFRDVNIAFANELSMICEKLGIDVWELIDLANRHPRVKILQPGPGVGGHCIPVDPWFIVDSAPELAHLIRTAREVNTSKTHHIIETIQAKLKHSSVKAIACFGFAFKANVDDFRESPAMEIIEAIAADPQITIFAVEPHAKSLPASLARFGNVKLVSIEDALKNSEVVTMLVEHREFGILTAENLRGKQIVDTRGVWRKLDLAGEPAIRKAS